MTPAPFPSAFQLEQMGLVQCSFSGDAGRCSTFIDPVSCPEAGGRCLRHRRRREQRLVEMRFAPLPDGKREKRAA